MTKREFHAEDAAGLAIMERQDPEKVSEWAVKHERMKPNVVFIHESRVVIAGGLGILWPGVAEAWIHIAQGCPGRALVEAKRHLYSWIKEYHLHRVHAFVLSDWEEGKRFLEWMGMHKEGTLMRFSPEWRDEDIWAWLDM